MEGLENSVMVEISVYIDFIKEVGLARDQFRGLAAIRYFPDMVHGQSFHCGVSSLDFQHAVEHNVAQRHTFHNPNLH